MACIIVPYEGATSLLWNNKRLYAGVLHTLSCLPTKSATNHKASITSNIIDMRHSPDNVCNYIGHFMDHFVYFFH